jgi:hypothetical protein
MIRLLSILKEAGLGQRELDPTSGVTTIFRGQDPQTGTMTWDVENPVDMKLVNQKIRDIIRDMKNVKKGTEEERVRKILQILSRDIAKNY